MRIAIDARMMGAMRTRGIGRYTEELVRGLLELLTPNDRLILLVTDPLTSPFRDREGVELRKADVSWYSWREQLLMPWILYRTRADVVHIPHWNVPFFYRGSLALTIHDLLLLHTDTQSSAKASTHHPFFFWIKRLAYRLTLWHALRQAKLIFVPTNYVAQDVKRFYPNAVTPVVTSEGLSRLPPAQTISLPYAQFLFYVGSAYPHKRLDLVLEAWPTLSERYPHLHLVLGGELDVFMARYQQEAQRRGDERVHFLGLLTDQDLANHYAQAAAFVFPSSHEGFGLPPLEALSFGCPLVSSDASCLPEVLPREGVFFFRNGDKNDMIRAIDEVLQRPSDARQSAQHAALQLSQRYAWIEVARKTLSGYRSTTPIVSSPHQI